VIQGPLHLNISASPNTDSTSISRKVRNEALCAWEHIRTHHCHNRHYIKITFRKKIRYEVSYTS